MQVPKKVIAEILGRSLSTISREIKRNTGKRGYQYKQANRFANERHKMKPKKIKLTDEIKELIKEKIKDDWSPEQIAGTFKKDGIISLHHETIYQYVLSDQKAGGDLYTHLRHQGKTYRKRYGSAHNRTGIPNRVSIDKRPDVVNKR
jgi:IS30 family transposase